MCIPDNLNRRLVMTAIAAVVLWSAWSYGDERLLFVRGGGIYTVNPDGTELRSAVEDVRIGSSVWLSPDGQWAIVERPNGDKEVVNLESGVVMASLGPYVGPFSWSPDSEWIAFLRFGRLLVIRRDGRDERLIVDSERLEAFLNIPFPLSPSMPKWDPFNPELVYFNILLGMGVYNIGVVNIDNGELRMVRPTIGWHLLDVHSPFSPDGTRLLVSDCQDGVSCIKILDLATDEVTGPIGPSGRHGADGNSPVWSPDGTQLAFTVGGGRGGLHIATATGGASRMLVEAEGSTAVPWGPVWLPAGDAIAFSMTDWTGTSGHEIYMIHPDGSGLRKVADGGDQVWWWTGASEGPSTHMRLETWGIIKQDSR